MTLERLQCLLDQIANVFAFLLRVIDSLNIVNFFINFNYFTISTVEIHILENVKNRQNLSIVWHQRLADHVATHDQMLEYLERRTNNGSASCIECIFNRDD